MTDMEKGSSIYEILCPDSDSSLIGKNNVYVSVDCSQDESHSNHIEIDLGDLKNCDDSEWRMIGKREHSENEKSYPSNKKMIFFDKGRNWETSTESEGESSECVENRVSSNLEAICYKLMESKDVYPHEITKLTKDELEIYHEIQGVIDVANRPNHRKDGPTRTVLSTVKNFLFQEIRQDKVYRSTNSHYYKKSVEVYFKILSNVNKKKDPLDEEQMNKIVEGFKNFGTGLTPEVYRKLTLNGNFLGLVKKMLEKMKDENQIIKYYLDNKAKEAVHNLLINPKEGYSLISDVREKLKPKPFRQRSNEEKEVTHNRIKFPLTKDQFKEALEVAREKLENGGKSSRSKNIT